jgi:hypothetical protein
VPRTDERLLTKAAWEIVTTRYFTAVMDDVRDGQMGPFSAQPVALNALQAISRADHPFVKWTAYRNVLQAKQLQNDPRLALPLLRALLLIKLDRAEMEHLKSEYRHPLVASAQTSFQICMGQALALAKEAGDQGLAAQVARWRKLVEPQITEVFEQWRDAVDNTRTTEAWNTFFDRLAAYGARLRDGMYATDVLAWTVPWFWPPHSLMIQWTYGENFFDANAARRAQKSTEVADRMVPHVKGFLERYDRMPLAQKPMFVPVLMAVNHYPLQDAVKRAFACLGELPASATLNTMVAAIAKARAQATPAQKAELATIERELTGHARLRASMHRLALVEATFADSRESVSANPVYVKPVAEGLFRDTLGLSGLPLWRAFRSFLDPLNGKSDFAAELQANLDRLSRSSFLYLANF